MKKFKDDIFLARWLNGELTDEERREFESSEDYTTYQKIIAGSDALQSPEFDEDALLNNIKSKKADQPISIHRSKRLWMTGIAASIALIIAFVFGVDYLNTKTYTADFGEQLPVTLPDGSEVILNSRAEISFNERSWSSHRELKLSGEAYFKVKKGEKFNVNTQHGSVTVLGTEFNVRTINSYFEVVCYEGKVRVKTNKNEAELNPGKGFREISGQSTSLMESQTAPSWLNQESSFKDIPLKYVLTSLENQYDIRFKGNIDKQLTFTGSFPNDDIELALKVVLGALQIDYQIDGQTVLIEAKE